MDRDVDLSIIIITHNNYEKKNGCIETVILSVLNQENASFEVIVVDNDSKQEDKNLLVEFISKMCMNECKNDRIKYVHNPQNNISSGRNVGSLKAKNNILVFMDDDIILPQKDILFQVSQAYKKKLYGYSAERIWTLPNWYEFQNHEILKKMINKSSNYHIEIGVPSPAVRGKKNNRHLLRTYVGNFGYIDKQLLFKVGGWREDFQGYGLEDDYMALRLYLEAGRPFLLENVKVVHVWHTISMENYSQQADNQKVYEKLLKQHGIRNFHTGRLLYNEDNVIEYYE